MEDNDLKARNTRQHAKYLVANKGCCLKVGACGTCFVTDSNNCNDKIALAAATKVLADIFDGAVQDSSTTPPEHDAVNQPSHYCKGGIECIDGIQAALTNEEFEGFCKGNALKYIWRESHKNKTQDILKAIFYLNRLVKGRETQ